MKVSGKQRAAFWFLFLFSFLGWVAVHAASISVPERCDPRAMLVVDVAVPGNETQPVKLTFEAAAVQYVGPVMPSEEIQNTTEGVIEIRKTGSEKKKFSLKFLHMGTASDTQFTLPGGETGAVKKVLFALSEPDKSHPVIFLVGALLLLIGGWFFWNYQKKAPSLMSTRSLFLNFEELQKVRDQFSLKAPVEEEKSSEVIPAEKDKGVVAGGGKPSDAVSPAPEPKVDSPTEPAPEGKKPSGDRPKTISRDDLRQEILHPGTKKDNGKPPESQNPKTAKNLVVAPELPDDSQKTPLSPLPAAVVPSEIKTDPSEAKTVFKPKSAKLDAILKGEATVGHLFVCLKDAKGNKFEGSGLEITIGRRKENVIVFSGSEISRNHAVIKVEKGQTVVRPLSSGNSTEVNGAAVTESSPLKTGDTLSLGGTPYQVETLKTL